MMTTMNVPRAVLESTPRVIQALEARREALRASLQSLEGELSMHRALLQTAAAYARPEAA